MNVDWTRARRYFGELKSHQDYVDLFYFANGVPPKDFPEDSDILYASSWSESYEGGSDMLFVRPGSAVAHPGRVPVPPELWTNETSH